MRGREMEEKGSKRHAPTVNYDYKPQGYGYRRKELPQGMLIVIYMNPDLHLENSFEKMNHRIGTGVFRETLEFV